MSNRDRDEASELRRKQREKFEADCAWAKELGLSMPTPSMSFTTDYQYIDFALRSRWPAFLELEREATSFKPKSANELLAESMTRLSSLRQNNPNHADEQLLAHLSEEAKYFSHPEMQRYFKFDERIMGEFVTVAFLAHALAEATINAFLALGLATYSSTEVFKILERADVLEKWTTGPKTFHPSYSLPKGGALYGALKYLIGQRNALVHSKIELSIAGNLELEGSRIVRAPQLKRLEWIRRLFSLPFDLANHARQQVPDMHFLVLIDRGSIGEFAPHKT